MPRRRGISHQALHLSLVAALLFAGACSDAVTAPETLDPEAVASVLPSVRDARTRLAPQIENAGVRERVLFDLEQLEQALSGNSAQNARFHARVSANLVAEYKGGRTAATDGPDVSALAITLYVIAQAIGVPTTDLL